MKASISLFFLVAILSCNSRFTSDNNHTLRVGIPNLKNINEYDTLKIQFASEYTILDHLFSPLIEINNNGELVSGIASKFYWEKNNAVIEIKKNYFSSNNHRITPDDIVISLKRAFLNGTSGNNFKNLFCENLKNLNDKCNSIQAINNKIIFKLNSKNNFFFHYLANIDFSIIPKSSIDFKSLKITNYKDTTGPYYYHKQTSDTVILKANLNYYDYNKDMPQTIILVRSERSNIIKKLKNNEIDLIPTINTVESKTLLKHFKKNIHKTLDIKTKLILYTPNGIKKFSRLERETIGIILKRHLLRKLNLTKTNQFFPKESFGYIIPNSVKSMPSVNVINKNSDTLILGTQKNNIKYYLKIFEDFIYKIDVVELNKIPLFENYNQSNADVVIINTDSSFNENISVINYSVNSGLMGIHGKKAKKWLKKYIQIEDSLKRLDLLKKLHLYALKNMYIVPISKSPYIAVSNRKWKMNFSKFYASTKMWKMRINPDFK